MGPKVKPSTTPLNLDQFILKSFLSTLHEPIPGFCLELENDKYGKNPPPPPSVFARTPPMEEFVCL